MYPEYLAYLWIPRSFFHPHTPQSLARISIQVSAKSCDSFYQVIMADLSHEGSYIYGRLVVLWFLSKSGSSRYSWNPIVASVNSVMASTSSISNPTLCWTYNLFKYQSSSYCFSLIRGIAGIISTEAVTWRIKGAKILDILPRYPAKMYRFYGNFFVWRCTEYLELREKLRYQELQNIWSECVALNTPSIWCSVSGVSRVLRCWGVERNLVKTLALYIHLKSAISQRC